MVFSVHLQCSAVTGIVNCPFRSQLIGFRSLKPAPPQWIWVFQESLSKGRKDKEKVDLQNREAELFQEIGKLKMELEWLKKKSQLLDRS
jgi:hypothetical protein